MREPEAAEGSGPPSVTKRWVQSSQPAPPTPLLGFLDTAARSQEWSHRGWEEAKLGLSVSLKAGRYAPTPTPGSLCPNPTHIDDGLLGLRHV